MWCGCLFFLEEVAASDGKGAVRYSWPRTLCVIGDSIWSSYALGDGAMVLEIVVLDGDSVVRFFYL